MGDSGGLVRGTGLNLQLSVDGLSRQKACRGGKKKKKNWEKNPNKAEGGLTLWQECLFT